MPESVPAEDGSGQPAPEFSAAASGLEPRAQAPQMSRAQVIGRAALLVFVVLLTVVLLANRERIAQFEHLGYPGIFLISILANATVLIPMPGVLFTSAMGAVFNPFYVALASSAGAALGELSGYLAGVGGQVWLDRSVNYQKLRHWIMRYPGWTIIILSFIPNPLFDMAGFIAGSMRMPMGKFLFFTFIGKMLKMLIFAYLGIGIIGLFR